MFTEPVCSSEPWTPWAQYREMTDPGEQAPCKEAPEPEQSNHLQGVASLSAESWYRQVLFSSANTNPKGWCSVPTNPGWTWSFKNLSILKVEKYF